MVSKSQIHELVYQVQQPSSTMTQRYHRHCGCHYGHSDPPESIRPSYVHWYRECPGLYYPCGHANHHDPEQGDVDRDLDVGLGGENGRAGVGDGLGGGLGDGDGDGDGDDGIRRRGPGSDDDEHEGGCDYDCETLQGGSFHS